MLAADIAKQQQVAAFFLLSSNYQMPLPISARGDLVGLMPLLHVSNRAMSPNHACSGVKPNAEPHAHGQTSFGERKCFLFNK